MALVIVAAAMLEQHPRRLWAVAVGSGAVAGAATSALGFDSGGGGVTGLTATLFLIATPRFVLISTAAGALLIVPTRGDDRPPRLVTQAGWLRKGLVWDRWRVEGEAFLVWRGHRRPIDALLTEATHDPIASDAA